MKLTVLILSGGRRELFRECCESVQRELPQADAEVLVIINGNHDWNVEYLMSLGDTRFRWLQVPQESVGAARNRAFALARGEIIHFLDDDVTLGPDFFMRTLARFDDDPELTILGGPNLTPPDSSCLEKAFGAVMASPFAAPRVNRRYRDDGIAERGNGDELILCNLAMRRNRIPEWLRFSEKLRSNEENLFLYECHQAGLVVVRDPELGVYHRRRPTLGRFAQQISSYGFGRAQQSRYCLKSLSIKFLLPALLWLVAPVLFLFSFRFFAAMGLLYLLLALLGVLKIPNQLRRGVPIWTLMTLTALVHLAYGWGFWGGVKRETISGFRAWSHQKLNPRRLMASLRSIVSSGSSAPKSAVG